MSCSSEGMSDLRCAPVRGATSDASTPAMTAGAASRPHSRRRVRGRECLRYGQLGAGRAYCRT
jgi:hypothetical protein